MSLLTKIGVTAVAAALAAAPSFAVEVVVTAPAGANGAHGVYPGGSGTAGQKGGDAVVSEQSLPGLPNLTVRATGGAGGTGGNGAPGAGAIPGGDAGAGGAGGNASAGASAALSAHSTNLNSFAVGGRGGNAGRPGSPGGRGATGGAGGNASSVSDGASSEGIASVSASSTGGRGGDAFGPGGRAGDGGTGQARARALSLTNRAGAAALVRGGDGGTGFGGAAAGNGGMARLENAAEAAGAQAYVVLNATGGRGGDGVGIAGGRGGDAAITQATTTNAEFHRTEATATGGRGGTGTVAGPGGNASVHASVNNTRDNGTTWAFVGSTAGDADSAGSGPGGQASARVDLTAANHGMGAARASASYGQSEGRADATSNVTAARYAVSHAVTTGKIARSVASARSTASGEAIASAEAYGHDVGATSLTSGANGTYQGARSISNGFLGANSVAGVTVEDRATSLQGSATVLGGYGLGSVGISTGSLARLTNVSEAYSGSVEVTGGLGLNYGHRDALLEGAPESRAALEGLQVIAAGSQGFALDANELGRQLEARHSLSFVAEKDSPLVLAMLGITGEPVGTIAFELWINGELVMSESLDTLAGMVGFFYDNVIDLEAVEGGTLQQIDLVTRASSDDPLRFGFNFTIGADITALAAVPEPSVWAMMIGGLLVMFVFGRRRAGVSQAA